MGKSYQHVSFGTRIHALNSPKREQQFFQKMKMKNLSLTWV